MKFTLSLILSIFIVSIAVSQTFTTPNTGVNWTLADIAAASPSTIIISGNEYTLLENLIISENDTVEIPTSLTFFVNANLLITVFGTFQVSGVEVEITATDTNAIFEGFRFEENSSINIQNTKISRSGGLRVLTEDFTLNNCEITNNESGATTSAAIQLSRGVPVITNNVITFNENSAIGSAANSQVSAFIFSNYIEGNNTANSNRPQINLGTTMPNQALQITQNTILGNPANEQTGGIAVANFTGGIILANIAFNIIRNNRYGITILGGNATVTVTNNIIEDNNIQNDPILGGSGINLNSSTVGNDIRLTDNEIRRNLYGVTLQGSAEVNLGDGTTNQGNNIFSENQNGGQIYALFNNTPNTIQAKFNCWIEGSESTAEEVENVISHVVDDPTLGEVIFNPFLCGVLGVEDFAAESFGFYPNPSKNEINFINNFNFEKVEIYGIQGNLISSSTVFEGENTISTNLSAGLYILKFSGDKVEATRKLIIQ